MDEQRDETSMAVDKILSDLQSRKEPSKVGEIELRSRENNTDTDSVNHHREEQISDAFQPSLKSNAKLQESNSGNGENIEVKEPSDNQSRKIEGWNTCGQNRLGNADFEGMQNASQCNSKEGMSTDDVSREVVRYAATVLCGDGLGPQPGDNQRVKEKQNMQLRWEPLSISDTENNKDSGQSVSPGASATDCSMVEHEKADQITNTTQMTSTSLSSLPNHANNSKESDNVMLLVSAKSTSPHENHSVEKPNTDLTESEDIEMDQLDIANTGTAELAAMKSEFHTHSFNQDNSGITFPSKSFTSNEGKEEKLPFSKHTVNENSSHTINENAVPSSDTSDSGDTEQASPSTANSSTKILTKYVYINKPVKTKSGKKSFGLLYRQAFRHFHKGKVRSKTVKPQGKKEQARKPQPKNTKKAVTAKVRSSPKKVKGKTRPKEEETITVESVRSTRSRTQKMEGKKVANRHSKRKEPAARSSSEPKKKKGRRKLVTLKEKVAIIEAMEASNNSVMSVVKDFEVSRTNIWRIMKKKEEILAQARAEGEKVDKKKKKKKQKKVKQESVEVKQEIDEELGVAEGDGNGNVGVFFGDVFSCPNRKSVLRNRRDLTLEEKVQVIKCLEAPGARVRGVARMFGVSSSAISRINKNKEFILLRSVSGDSCANERRSRDCKDPELDKALLRWFRAIEQMQSDGSQVAISNILLKSKVHDLAITMGKDYFPSDNWIVRWKHRHNIGSKPKSSVTLCIQSKEELQKYDDKVDIDEILKQLGKEAQHIDQVKREAILKRQEKPDEFMICPHCGVLTNTKKKKQNNHVAGCPLSSSRKDLTLEEKYQVVRALEQPGMKMITLAKKYGVSTSAISRINKNRIDILSRRASGLANGTRRRDRGSKEPEVEKVLCDWFKVQNDLGIHISGSMIRDKAREIAKLMGKDFWPSESWVFRWRHRNNVTEMNPLLYGESEDEEEGGLERTNDTAEDVAVPNSSEEMTEPAAAKVEQEGDDAIDNNDLDGNEGNGRKKKRSEENEEAPSEKRFRLPRSVMCEKCGFVSFRVKNKRIKSLRHAKGCPDQKPRNELTYENRAKILKALEEPGATLSSVAREFGISVSSMSRMNQQKERILTHGQDHGGQKRIRDCKEPEVAYNLYCWYMEKKAEGIHVTGPKLKERAKKLAAEMGREFNASSGWLGRWRHRYNIIGSANRGERVQKTPSLRRKRHKKNMDAKSESPTEHLTQLQPIPTDLHQDSLGSQTSVIVEPLEPIPPPPQPATVFLHQRFQNPWDLAQQQPSSCVWTKEFIAPGPSTQEEPMAPVSYAYTDTVPKPVFHNMFDSFSTMGYQVAMPVDSSMVGRDYMKTDNGEEAAGPGGHMAHKPHPSHQQLPHHHRTNLNPPHLQHHPALSHPHPHPHANALIHQPSLPPQPQTSHQLPPASPATGEEDPEQQRQVMEAFKIMSSFAAKKSLGGQVQAALRTIEMSMKNSSKKPASRHTYTSI